MLAVQCLLCCALLHCLPRSAARHKASGSIKQLKASGSIKQLRLTGPVVMQGTADMIVEKAVAVWCADRSDMQQLVGAQQDSIMLLWQPRASNSPRLMYPQSCPRCGL